MTPTNDTPSPSRNPGKEPVQPWLRAPAEVTGKFAVPEPGAVAADAGAKEEPSPPPDLASSPRPDPLDLAAVAAVPEPGMESAEERAERRAARWSALDEPPTGDLGWPVRIPVRERALAILLGALATLAVVCTPSGYGLSWDEAYYYQPSLDAAGWLASAVRLEGGWSSVAATEEGFGRVWELPPVVKLANGFAWALASPALGPLRSMRLPSAFAFGLTIALLYAIAWLAWRRTGAVAAVVVYATMPRVFGHAHLAASETITAFMTVLVVYSFLRGLESRSWSVLFAVFLAAALATKINAVFLPAILLPWAWLHARKQSLNNLYAMLFLAPPLFFLFWPWLWHDTVYHVLKYIDFAASHPKLGLWFQGQKWNFNAPPAPWYYPAKIAMVTLPPLTAIAVAAGVLLSVVRWKYTNPLGRLGLWAAIVLVGVASVPSTPKYDGIRLFFPAMPFLALLGGGFIARAARLGTRLPFPEFLGLTGRQLLATGATVALGVGGIVSVSLSHPHELSYYNVFVGGTAGADRRGYEITYWGEAMDDEVLAEMNRLLPPNARLKIFALHDLALRLLQQWGKLRSDIRLEDTGPFDAYLLLYRKGFWGRAETALFKDGTPVGVWGHDGVPLLLLYLQPRDGGFRRGQPTESGT